MPREALLSWFLGPRAENAELLERLVMEALRDHVFWRRNYRPEDGFTIRETDKRTPGYEQAVATLTQELLGLLAQLKRDVPFFSGRYKGHMLYEPTIASLVGYFATMLYNPNNVTVDVAPVTTRLELEVGAELARMLGYDPRTAWGHLTSGGTVANFEALWLARNILYLPVAAAGTARELGLGLEMTGLDGGRIRLADAGLWELLNLRGRDALDLWTALHAAAPVADVYRALAEHSLAAVGYQGYHDYLTREYGDALPASVVLVAATAHYSWEKIVRALGIGSNQLVHVPVDPAYRMDPGALWELVRGLSARRVPILACVSVCGTTEEGAVDRLDQVLAVRDRAERELGVTFHVHSDACYGGYAAALTWRADGSRRTGGEIAGDTGAVVDDGWLAAMAALAGADSVTVDPHKLGYVPYPAGAIVLRDRRARDLVAVDPPYLLPAEGRGGREEGEVLGRYVFEGSKPGAAAAAVWLSHKVLPLDERGYGYLVGRTMAAARRLHHELARADFAPFRVLLAPPPDLNVLCYLFHHPRLRTLDQANAFNEAVYRHLSHGRPGADPEYIITRTHFCAPAYAGAVDPLLAALGVCTPEEWRASGAAGLVVLRSTVMDPFLGAPPPAPDHVGGFIRALGRACAAALAAVAADTGA